MKQARYRFRLAKKDGHRVFLKIGVGRELCDQLRNEARIHAFLHRITPKDASWYVPKTRYLTKGKITIAESEYLSAFWLGKKDPLRLTRPWATQDLEDVFQFMLFLHTLREKDLPASVLKQAKTKFTYAHYLKKFHEYLTPAIGTLLTQSEADELEQLMRKSGFRQRFVHHDIVPWNLGRMKDGKLAIIDAEFARWGMKWYDVAYFYLQMSVLMGDDRFARRALRYVVQRFAEERPTDHLSKEIFFSLCYRLSANIWVAAQSDDQKQKVRAKRMLKRVLTGDLQRLF